MQQVRVSPTELTPTHHIALRDRQGKEIGLILTDERGQAKNDASSFVKNPIETTALKQTSGASSYDIYDYPYSPIVQDDLSGGRGNQDFERDSTKYFDSFRAKSGRANKAYAGPQEVYATGVRTTVENMPGNVKWHTLTGERRHLYKRFSAVSMTVTRVWALVRKRGEPADLTISLYADSTGNVGTLLVSATIAASRMNDTLSEWLCDPITNQALTASTYYWFVINASDTDNSENHWKIAVSDTTGTSYYSGAFDSTPTGAAFDLYFRVTPAQVPTRRYIGFNYMDAQYFIKNETSGAPALYIAGDRGAADPNTGTLNKLIDSSKTWTVNEWAGATVQIVSGPGKLESDPYRTIVSNTANELVVSPSWEIEHTTGTNYIIHGTKLKEITGHGLTGPVTDVLITPSANLVYFCQGPSILVRRMREYNNAGAWTTEYADEAAGTYADFMIWMPSANKIVSIQNNPAQLKVMSNASYPAWGTALTWATAIAIDYDWINVTGVEVYPNEAGNESVWLFKENGIWTHDAGTGRPVQISLKEFVNVRSKYAGYRPLHHGVYIYFPLQYGLERFYGNQYDDVGPNLGEGLPLNRRGPIVSMVGYPGKFHAAIDAGSTGYSSVLDSDGWHERYRAPYGQRITYMCFQTVPGPASDRLWICQGNDLLYLPFPSETPNELEDTSYKYTHEFSVTLARMHAGIFDIQKMIKLIKVQSEALEVDSEGEPVTWFELDYRTDGDTDWKEFETKFTVSPNQSIELISMLGLAGRRLQFRLRGYTTDASKTPVFLAIIINAVIRTDAKYMYPITFRLMDNEPLLHEGYDTYTAAEKLKIIEDWADASSDSMLRMSSLSPLFDNKIVFINPPTTRQIRHKLDTDNDFQKDVYICNITAQEA